MRKEDELYTEWSSFLGLKQIERRETIPDPVITERVRFPLFERQKIFYSSCDGRVIPAYLFCPFKRSSEPHPGVVVFHQTGMDNIYEAAGICGDPALNLGEYMAEKGEFTVLCPMNWIYYFAMEGFPVSLQIFRREYPEKKGMTRMLEDAMDAVTLLTSVYGANPERIGAVGHSLGGKVSFYLGAFDRRIKVTVCSEFGVGLDHCNYHDEQYLGTEIKRTDFQLSHHDLFRLIAPRALFIVAGGFTDGSRSLPYIEKAMPLFPSKKLQFLNHRQGHTIPAGVREKIYQKIKKELAEWNYSE